MCDECMCECVCVMGVCMYGYTGVCLCVCVYGCVAVCVCICVYVSMCACLCVSVYMCVPVYVCVYMSVSLSLCVYVCVCVYMYLCVYVCLCVYVSVCCMCLCVYGCRDATQSMCASQRTAYMSMVLSFHYVVLGDWSQVWVWWGEYLPKEPLQIFHLMFRDTVSQRTWNSLIQQAPGTLLSAPTPGLFTWCRDLNSGSLPLFSHRCPKSPPCDVYYTGKALVWAPWEGLRVLGLWNLFRSNLGLPYCSGELKWTDSSWLIPCSCYQDNNENWTMWQERKPLTL